MPTAKGNIAVIGKIQRAVGIHGDVSVESFSSFPDRWTLGKGLKTLFLGDDEETAEPVEVCKVSVLRGSIVLRFTSVKTREAAEGLRGKYLFIESSDLHPLSEDEFYVHDLIGMEIVDASGNSRGAVSDVLFMPANEVLIVSNGNHEELIPFIHDAIESVDLRSRSIRLKALDGLFEGRDSKTSQGDANRHRHRVSSNTRGSARRKHPQASASKRLAPGRRS